ncbi:hypothetical protein ACT7SZ_003455 [Vibrio cholerae]
MIWLSLSRTLNVLAVNLTAFGVGRVFERCFCVKCLSSKCV